jgi:hypothetical protein
MLKLISFIFVLAFVAVGLADAEIPLPGPGIPPTRPQPTPTPPQSPGSTTYTLGTSHIRRYRDRTFTYPISSSLNDIRALRITCTNQRIEIKKVIIQFTNGKKYDELNLRGTLGLGDSRITYLYGNTVSRITVVASNAWFFYRHGVFRIDATAATAGGKSDVGDSPDETAFQLFE